LTTARLAFGVFCSAIVFIMLFVKASSLDLSSFRPEKGDNVQPLVQAGH
jgi:hypothetical protein